METPRVEVLWTPRAAPAAAAKRRLGAEYGFCPEDPSARGQLEQETGSLASGVLDTRSISAHHSRNVPLNTRLISVHIILEMSH